MRRRVRDESLGLKGRRQDVTPAAAADENLASAVGRALEQQHVFVCGAGAGKDGRDQSGRARADHNNHYFSTSSTGTTRTGPRLAARIGASIFDKSPTTI